MRDPGERRINQRPHPTPEERGLSDAQMMNRTHYIFVDYENIHEVELDLIAAQPVTVILVLGERHKKLPVDLVKKLLTYPTQVRLVEAGRSGKNALDFVLSYLIGVQTTTDRTGHFHILSRDKGFDALIEHLKKNDIFADRQEVFAKIPVLLSGTAAAARPAAIVPRKAAAERAPRRRGRKRPPAPAAPDRVKETVDWFANHTANRPKTRTKLLSHIYTHFGKRLSPAELEAIVSELIARDSIELTAHGKVLYKI
jgi:hypothetical protein